MSPSLPSVHIELADGHALNFAAPDPDHTWTLLAPLELQAWAEHLSENGRDTPGMVQAHLENEGAWRKDADGGREAITASLNWIVQNQLSTRDVILKALVAHVKNVLIDEYGIDDEELQQIQAPEDLLHMIQLSEVWLSGRMEGDVPVWAAVFECNWDPEHGCSVSLHGDRVIDAGTDVAYDIF